LPRTGGRPRRKGGLLPLEKRKASHNLRLFQPEKFGRRGLERWGDLSAGERHQYQAGLASTLPNNSQPQATRQFFFWESYVLSLSFAHALGPTRAGIFEDTADSRRYGLLLFTILDTAA